MPPSINIMDAPCKLTNTEIRVRKALQLLMVRSYSNVTTIAYESPFLQIEALSCVCVCIVKDSFITQDRNEHFEGG